MRGRKLDIENMTIHEEASDRKDCSSRWTDENGKLSIQFDVFDTNLPSADEVHCRSCQSHAIMTWTFLDQNICLEIKSYKKLLQLRSF